MTIANFHPAGGHAKPLPSMPTLKCKVASPLTILVLSVLSLNTAHAALTATTAQTIQGTAPYFTLGGVPLNNTAELLGFTYTDASGTAGTKASANDAVNNTTIIVDPNMKMSDIKALVPITNSSTQLSAILGGDLAVADADGDATAANISATGALKAYWTKDGTEGYMPSSTEKFTACSTYQLTIAIVDPSTNNVASADGNIEAQTIYGDPNTQQYAYPATAGSTSTTIYSATYTVIPKPGMTYVCYAQPNLTHGSGQYAGSPTQWDPDKGFLPQTSPNKNFPTTGFYGAWFNLKVEGTTARDIINATTAAPTIVGGELTGYVASGDVKLRLVEASPNVVTITLFGPRDGTVAIQTEASAPIHAFSPTSFTLKDGSGTSFYQFTIEKWFITKNVTIAYSTGGSNTWSNSNPYGFNGNLETPKYCANLGGSGSNYYKVPMRAEFTNSVDATIPAWNGSTGGGFGSPNNYRRTIGGGLFAEWGYLWKGSGGYPESEFVNSSYWASEPNSGARQYIIHSREGFVFDINPDSSAVRAVCVSP